MAWASCSALSKSRARGLPTPNRQQRTHSGKEEAKHILAERDIACQSKLHHQVSSGRAADNPWPGTPIWQGQGRGERGIPGFPRCVTMSNWNSARGS